ncbi:MAG: uracil-DNA glycosylase family protein [bacterium]
MQATHLHKKVNDLQTQFGDSRLAPIYGAGCIKHPVLMLVFMNPTGKNVAAKKSWRGLRAPWLGTKNVWKLLHRIRAISTAHFRATQQLKPSEWTPAFCKSLYSEIATHRIFITNLAKCTQQNARPLANTIFEKYLKVFQEEVQFVKPEKIILFGNQVSSILLRKRISVRDYPGIQYERITISNAQYLAYPTWYPVGQGMRNLHLAIQRIRKIIAEI